MQRALFILIMMTPIYLLSQENSGDTDLNWDGIIRSYYNNDKRYIRPSRPPVSNVLIVVVYRRFNGFDWEMRSEVHESHENLIISIQESMKHLEDLIGLWILDNSNQVALERDGSHLSLHIENNLLSLPPGSKL